MLNKLKELISSYESVVVAFSGGVDSSLLAFVAREVLGDKMIAVTAESPSVPSRDRRSANEFAKQLGIPHETVKTCECDLISYVANPENRCFFCKDELFATLERVADAHGFNFVLEGTNASEILGHRPGFEAAKKRGRVKTPYVELGMTKDDVRKMARVLSLDIAERPSSACLASRIPTGTRITPELLHRVDLAEEYLLGLGCRQVRLRHNGETARIETDDAGMKIVCERAKEIVDRVSALGWKNVTLDLKGYRTGGGM